MDWSPILISMKTASLSIFITFFWGIFAAWAVVSMKNETWKLIWDGVLTPLVLPLRWPVFSFSICSGSNGR